MIPREIKIQEEIINKLQKKELYPFSVLFSFASPDNGGMLSITFYIKSDLLEFLNILDYKSQCDKSGWIIIEKTNTIIFSGLALLLLYSSL